MNKPPDEKKQLDELIQAYQDIKKSNQGTTSQNNTQTTGKYKPIPLPPIDKSKVENK